MGHSDESTHCNNEQLIKKPVSPEEREQIIQDIISSQMLAGIEIDYEAAAEAFDEAYRLPMPFFKTDENS